MDKIIERENNAEIMKLVLLEALPVTSISSIFEDSARNHKPGPTGIAADSYATDCHGTKTRLGRNEQGPCGSGKKVKRCAH